MTDRRTHIALDFLRLAQEDLVRASRLVTTRIQLAYDYGATEHDIMHTLKTEGGHIGREGRQTLRAVPD